VSNRHVIIILGVTVLEPNRPRIGHPVDIETALSSHSMAPAVQQPPVHQPLYNTTNYLAGPSSNPAAVSAPDKPTDRPVSSSSHNPYGRMSSSPAQAGNNYSMAQAPIVRSSVATGMTPIASLNMYNNRWTLQARVTNKSDIKTWSNAKGEGSLFSVELLDATQDIRATFFKEAVDKFYHMLQVGSVYTFTGGRLKVASLQYNTCKSQYEISFDQNAEIHLANDDGAIAKQLFTFTKLAALEGVEANKNVDVVAIVKSVSDPVQLISKKTGQELQKCDVVLVDDSGVEVNLTIWGDRAQSAPRDLAGQPVVALARARVSDYGGGVSLSAGPTLTVGPDVPETAVLSAWWSGEAGRGATVQSRSLSGSGGAGRMDSWADRKTISAIKQENMGLDMKADYLSFRGTLSFIKNNKEGGSWYPACANSGEPCKNRFKVTQGTDLQWHCEKCEQYYPNCVHRWIFSGVVMDATSSTWVSFFNEQAETLLGEATAEETFQSTNMNGGFEPDPYNSVFVRAQYSEWIFKCKVKSEFHNDESKIKTSVASLHPVNYLQESRELLAAIGQL
jgi:replication factor A1